MVKLKYAILQIISILVISYFILFKPEPSTKDLVYVTVWCAIYVSSLLITYNNNKKEEHDKQD